MWGEPPKPPLSVLDVGYARVGKTPSKLYGCLGGYIMCVHAYGKFVETTTCCIIVIVYPFITLLLIYPGSTT